jgi:hypothetical protein
MKTKVLTLLIVALGCFAISVQAQTKDESAIKVLPTCIAGTIKVLHAASIEKDVNVIFINRDGEILKDRITGTFPKGVMKSYDVSRIEGSDFLVQVSSKEVTVTYRVTASKDKKRYTPMLEKVEYHNQLVASR